MAGSTALESSVVTVRPVTTRRGNDNFSIVITSILFSVASAAHVGFNAARRAKTTPFRDE
jgi:hypothetical protein